MRRLSISLAWEQTKSCLAADGRLFATVAAALVALPVAVAEVIKPGGFALDTTQSPWLFLVILAMLLFLLVGQLSIVRLAIGPSVSVGEAIVHGVRRLPFYFLSIILIGAAFLIIVIAGGVILLSTGVQVSNGQLPTSPAVAVIALALLVAYCFLWVRVIVMSAPVASAEAAGPLVIIRRSWDLTVGHFWRLFGFLVAFLVGAAIALAAIQSVTGLLTQLLFGAIDPLSVSALVVGLVDGVANAVVVTILTVMMARIYVQLSGRGSMDVSVPSSGT